MSNLDKPLVWLQSEIKTPPFSASARMEAGRCHELRIVDEDKSWRIVYRIDIDAIVILEVFQKKTQETPRYVIDNCQRRIKQYDS